MISPLSPLHWSPRRIEDLLARNAPRRRPVPRRRQSSIPAQRDQIPVVDHAPSAPPSASVVEPDPTPWELDDLADELTPEPAPAPRMTCPECEELFRHRRGCSVGQGEVTPLGEVEVEPPARDYVTVWTRPPPREALGGHTQTIDLLTATMGAHPSMWPEDA